MHLASRNGRRKALLAAALAVVAGAAQAQVVDFDALLKRPDFQVTRKTENGEEVIEARKGTVTFTKTRAGIVGYDDSTAVLCAWDEYVTFKIVADTCLGDSEAELKQDLGDAVRRLSQFIVANSLAPVPPGALEARIEERRKKMVAVAEKLPKTPDGRPRCVRNETLEAYRADGHAKRVADVDKIVAVPRPPVLNPCL